MVIRGRQVDSRGLAYRRLAFNRLGNRDQMPGLAAEHIPCAPVPGRVLGASGDICRLERHSTPRFVPLRWAGSRNLSHLPRLQRRFSLPFNRRQSLPITRLQFSVHCTHYPTSKPRFPNQAGHTGQFLAGDLLHIGVADPLAAGDGAIRIGFLLRTSAWSRRGLSKSSPVIRHPFPDGERSDIGCPSSSLLGPAHHPEGDRDEGPARGLAWMATARQGFTTFADIGQFDGEAEDLAAPCAARQARRATRRALSAGSPIRAGEL